MLNPLKGAATRIGKSASTKALKADVRSMSRTGLENLGKIGIGTNRMAKRQVASEAVANANFRRGRRRAIGIGAVLGANAMLAPRAPKSSGGSGYTTPRSSGGYA